MNFCLFSKFFDSEHDPVIEVIRDTVGRHDTFNYACTAKYYEDMGYLGHINCSENFNNALKIQFLPIMTSASINKIQSVVNCFDPL